MFLSEAVVEDAALTWFGEMGYEVGHGPHIARGEPAAERVLFADVMLVRRLREAINRLNPEVPDDAREDALRKVLRIGTPSLAQTDRAFHRLLRNGVGVEYPHDHGSIAGDRVRLVDFASPHANVTTGMTLRPVYDTLRLCLVEIAEYARCPLRQQTLARCLSGGTEGIAPSLFDFVSTACGATHAPVGRHFRRGHQIRGLTAP